MADAMVKMTEKEVGPIFAVAYKGTVMAMQGYLGFKYVQYITHVVPKQLELRQNGLDPANLFGWYRKLFNITARKERGHPEEDTIALLHG